MNKNIKLILILIFSIFSFNCNPMLHEEPIENGILFKTIHGNYKITEPLLIELINHEAIQRLKHVYQGGPSHFVVPHILYKGNIKGYTRYDHSINCMIIARKKLSNKEFSAHEKLIIQAAALLHDVSHGLFSHVIDLVKKAKKADTTKEEAYQDKILKDFLKDHGIDEILNKYNIKIDDVLPDENELYLTIKQSNGKLCIDRVEYTLSECFLTGILKKGEINKILRNLSYYRKNRNWYFTNIDLATKFGDAALDLVDLNSGSLWNVILYNLMAKIMKLLVRDNKLLTNKDLSYAKIDAQFWHELKSIYKTKKEEVRNIMHFVEQMEKGVKTFLVLKNKTENSSKIKAKFRGINPMLLQLKENSFTQLTASNKNFKQKFLEKRNKIEKGRFVEFNDPEHPLYGKKVIYGC
ncbi:HD domain-containing protein [Candidatus Dependentiae bacterium]|nr:HD domain-containing protein [Candidatus Dependentiae bacterium]